MRYAALAAVAFFGISLAAISMAEPPGDGPPDEKECKNRPPEGEAGPPRRRGGPEEGRSLAILDLDHDGSLSVQEIHAASKTLSSLDLDSDGILSERELSGRRGRRGPPPSFEPRGGNIYARFDSDDDRPPPPPPGPPRREDREERRGPPRHDRPHPPGPPGGPPELGDVLPPFVRHALKLSEEQQQSIASLEKETKSRLTEILTEEQKETFDRLVEQGPPPRPHGPPPRRGGDDEDRGDRPRRPQRPPQD